MTSMLLGPNCWGVGASCFMRLASFYGPKNEPKLLLEIESCQALRISAKKRWLEAQKERERKVGSALGFKALAIL